MGIIIDKQGKLFGKVNLIDFLITLALVLLIPFSYYFYKIITKESQIEESSVYEARRSCPNCKKSLLIDTIEGEVKGIPKGQPLPKFYETVCKRCGNKVVLIEPSPLEKPPLSYNEQYYKRQLEKMGKGTE